MCQPCGKYFKPKIAFKYSMQLGNKKFQKKITTVNSTFTIKTTEFSSPPLILFLHLLFLNYGYHTRKN